MTSAYYPQSRIVLPRFLLVLVLTVGVILCAHAVLRHGEDAQAVRRCMDNGGLVQIWSEKNGCITHNIVKLDGERQYGDQIQVKGSDGQQHEVTSFIPRNGNLEKIVEWITKKGGQLIWRK